MVQILLATSNRGKMREIREMTAGTPLGWVSLDEFPDVPVAAETADSFAENARQKALYYARATRLYTLADDSGLEVDALGGAPGVRSARYAGAESDDAANNRRLITELAAIPLADRTARFRCAMAFARPGEVLIETAGSVEGVIIDRARGHNGFGYDPHFVLPLLDRTLAELPPAEKSMYSHRGQALREMLAHIELLFRSLGQWDM